MIELRYEYYRMGSPCPLCECMISRFRTAQHQLQNIVRQFRIYRKIIKTKPITYRRADGTYEYENYDCYQP